MLPLGKHTPPSFFGHDLLELKKHLRQTDSCYRTSSKSDESNINEMAHFHRLLDVLQRQQHLEINHIVRPLRTKSQWLIRSEKLWEIFKSEVDPVVHPVAISEWEPLESSWPKKLESDATLSATKDSKAPILYLKEKDFWGYNVKITPNIGKPISLGLSVSNDWHDSPEISFQAIWSSSDKTPDNENLTETDVEKCSVKSMVKIHESQTEELDQNNVHSNRTEIGITNILEVGGKLKQNEEIQLESQCVNKNENDYNKLEFSEQLPNCSIKEIFDIENTITRCICTQTKPSIIEKSVVFPRRLFSPGLNARS
ncbi:uncharacterized protein LOC106874555 [Octopus bimaculoides]|uniref:Uncharacterized protein n=1 Tax=Octopus bimaculoides TaxID=37653 RepID=A0A0L8GUP0_OCTBM|nr:uncharacterized protein LOC106874555 [Octopus bimaculoides]XP_052825590.1 uncharacterized protein LOC106874555 [Octopus bimaculoides]XP_052825591.1 uncharacterized protein LOC106874555 [Octopus bimaculoides]|eukprot:XP_014777812.1 PREDICTED: uncharacterized protein LOC106874555 [Octopus bimaculoides]